MKRKKPTLTARRREILLFIQRGKSPTCREIVEKFWPELSPSDQRKSIRRLLKTGWVEKIQGDQGVVLGFTLSRKGRYVLMSQNLYIPGTKNRSVYRTTFDHDVIVRQAREVFERCSIVRSFVPAWEFPKGETDGKSEVPDAILEIKLKEIVRLALEVELSAKSAKRYERVLRQRLLSKRYEVVLYIVDGEPLLRKIKAILSRLIATDVYVRLAKTPNEIYFCSIAEFQERGIEATFRNERYSTNFAGLEHEFGEKGPKSLEASPKSAVLPGGQLETTEIV